MSAVLQVAQERSLREALVDFLLGVLDLDPQTRWTPRQALQHPFITGGIFQVGLHGGCRLHSL